MSTRGRSIVAAVLAAAVLGWPAAATAGPRAGAAPDQPAEPRSDGKVCATGAQRPYVLTTTPVLTARQSDPDAGRPDLTTTFAWWQVGGTLTGRVSQTAGNPSVVSASIPAGRLTDGGTYAWHARTSDGSHKGPWSAPCEFTVDVTSPEPPAGVTSTDYPADGPHGGPGIAGQFVISAPTTRPAEVVAYAWTTDGAIPPSAAATVPADATTHGATLTFAPARDGVVTLRVWSQDRAGHFSATPATWTFFVKAISEPQPVRPLPPTISFPGGDTTDQGGTLSLRLDANGDTSVTRFRYSIRSTALDLTAVPDRPGGSVVVRIPAGTLTGTSQVFAKSSTGSVDSLLTQGSFTVRSLTSLTGLVLDVATFLPVEGATVRVEPGNHAATTNAAGEFSFPAAELPAGDYTVTASYGGCSGEQPVYVDGSGLYLEILLLPGESGNESGCGSQPGQ
ncbi:hypothetical protein GCM10010172_84590 [Paractinoplanes ferrugineus]|uniref:Alpha-amylase n=1 Tax=Paractinoplanes ferrugineus TaxID=113564 RepID=A0A919IXQ3_9ACTN|nr:carboxypeptidase regulatory-like domain-containing protein [Actinoplanes ferrugineus]GIE10780.1 hypothetical protein Afe05nite_26200 [Actinoplanes ferrugineus]